MKNRTFSPLPSSLLIVAIALASHLPALRNGIVWDDHFFVEQGPASTLGGLLLEPFRLGGGPTPYYRPLVNLSIALEHALWGAAPLGYHLVNLALHAAVALLLVRLLLPRVSPVPAIVAAGIFAAHPVHVEAVTFIVGRCDLLAALLLLGAVITLCNDPCAAPRTWHSRRSLLAGLLFLLALLSKENVVLAVAIPPLLLFRRGPRRPGPSELVAVTLPFLAGLVVYAGLRAYVFWEAGQRLPSGRITATFAQQVPWLFEVLRLLVFPQKLIPYHVLPEPSPGRMALWLAIILMVAGALAALGRARKGDALYTLGLALLVLPLIPAFPVFPRVGSLLAERFLYLPSAGFAILIAASADLAWKSAGAKPARSVISAIGAVAIVAGASWTALRTTDWRDETTLFSRALERDPENYALISLLADEHIFRGDYGMAETLHKRAIALNPRFPRPRIGLSHVYEMTGRPDAARSGYRAVLALEPGNIDVLLRLGLLEMREGSPAAARETLQRALVIDPGNETARKGLQILAAPGGNARQ